MFRMDKGGLFCLLLMGFYWGGVLQYFSLNSFYLFPAALYTINEIRNFYTSEMIDWELRQRREERRRNA